MHSMHAENSTDSIWVDSPVGQLKVMASANGVVSIRPMENHGLQAVEASPVNTPLAVQGVINAHLSQAGEELEAYFRGELTHFNVALDLSGTDFQQQVWRALQQIRYGEICSYQKIAEGISRPRAVRAVGAANGANPVAIIVPCHRVIGKNGKLTGYAYGLEMKQYLLSLEQKND